jgi:hypothetical protein
MALAFRSIGFLLLLLFSIGVRGQTGIGDQKNADPSELVSPQVPKWVLKTNPLRTLWGPIPFTSEYRLNVETIQARYQSIQVGVSYLGESPVLSVLVDAATPQSGNQFGSLDIQVRGGRFQFAYKYYLRGIFSWLEPSGMLSSYAPNGYYIAPYFSMAYARFKMNNLHVPFFEATHLNANLILGRQLFYWGSFATDFFVGFGIKENVWERRNPINHNAGQVVDPSDMGLYGGKYRLVLGVDLGFHF